MGKSTKKKNKKVTAPKANIQELSISRDGGQIALRGYSYQFLYSCYLILSSSNPSNFFQLEGIEDIDCIMQKNGSNDITHPYPVDVTAQMLDCFSEKYDLPEKKVTDVDEFPIGDIAEELWIYSKSVELLTEPEDACYLADQTQDIQPNIAEMLRLLKNKLPFKDVDWLIEICDNVFSGEKFDDIMFNNVIEHFIQKKIEQ